MSRLVAVTGGPGVPVREIASTLAEALGLAHLSVDGIWDELAHDADETPRDWLRVDAERELERRLMALAGRGVVDVVLETDDEAARMTTVLGPWWDQVVEIRCAAPGESTPSLGAPRTVLLDGVRPPAAADVAAVVRDETPGARRSRRR